MVNFFLIFFLILQNGWGIKSTQIESNHNQYTQHRIQPGIESTQTLNPAKKLWKTRNLIIGIFWVFKICGVDLMLGWFNAWVDLMCGLWMDSILGGFDAPASKLLLKHRVEEKLSVFCHIQQNCNSSFSGFQQIFYQNILV